MVTTKIYENTGKETLNVLGVGEIEAGGRMSVTAEYQPAVVLSNYPGLVDITDEPGPSGAGTPAAPASEESETNNPNEEPSL